MKTKYSEEMTAKVCSYIIDGDSETTAARRAGIAGSTHFDWKNRYPEYSEAIKNAVKVFDETAVEKVEQSLFKRAVGYQYTETSTKTKSGQVVETVKKVVKVAPDVGAIVFFLTNRAPERWKNKQVQDIRAAVEGELQIDKPKIVFDDGDDEQ